LSPRDNAMAGVVEAILTNISDVGGLVEKLETAGGCGKLVAAIRDRLVAPPPAAGKPDAVLWAEAAERMVRR
jgi:hypothetical protein